ncbi:MAG: hypothetical protein ACRDZ4_13070 [Egibacteraceae bacterium]
MTGRELARWFERDTPGLSHRHALNFLMPDTGWSPPFQALLRTVYGVGARLATGNPADFPMTELQVEHWPVGG